MKATRILCSLAFAAVAALATVTATPPVAAGHVDQDGKPIGKKPCGGQKPVIAGVARPPAARAVIVDALGRTAECDGATVTSAERTPHDQARIMFANLLANSGNRDRMLAFRNMYGPIRRAPVDVFVAALNATMGDHERANQGRACCEATACS